MDSSQIPASTPVTEEDVLLVLKKLKSNKAPGPNEIRNEHLKYAGPAFTQVLVQCALNSWKNGLPTACKIFDLVSLPKKGNTALPQNRRGIQIADKLYQIISAILARELRNGNEERLSEVQAGYRLKRGCRDQRFSFQMIIDTAMQLHEKPLFVALIDLEKAFDRVDRAALLEIMRSAGVENDLIAAANDLHTGTHAQVRWRGHRSDAFPTTWGVQQGSAASNPEWNLVADVLTRQIQEAVGPAVGITLYLPSTARTLFIGRGPLSTDLIVQVLMLLLADDIAVFAESADAIDHFLQMMNEVCTRWGFTISINKTHIMVVTGGDRPANPSVRITGQEIAVVEAAKYLVSWYTETNSLDKELNVRVGASYGAAKNLTRILQSRNVQLPKKLKVYNGLVLPILLYGAESWPYLLLKLPNWRHFIKFNFVRFLA